MIWNKGEIMYQSFGDDRVEARDLIFTNHPKAISKFRKGSSVVTLILEII